MVEYIYNYFDPPRVLFTQFFFYFAVTLNIHLKNQIK